NLDHLLGYVEADDSARSAASKLQRVAAGPATHIQNSRAPNRLRLLQRVVKALVHVPAKNRVEEIADSALAVRVDRIEASDLFIPETLLPGQFLIHIPIALLTEVNSKSLNSRSSLPIVLSRL